MIPMRCLEKIDLITRVVQLDMSSRAERMQHIELRSSIEIGGFQS